jgi:hypothetical protein
VAVGRCPELVAGQMEVEKFFGKSWRMIEDFPENTVDYRRVLRYNVKAKSRYGFQSDRNWIGRHKILLQYLEMWHVGPLISLILRCP